MTSATGLALLYRDPDGASVAEDKVNLTVFPCTLKTYQWNASELTMDREDEPGNYLAFNNDDDDGNDTQDANDPGHANENDLQRVRFEFGGIFAGLATGKVIVERSSGNLRLWKASNKGAGQEIAFSANRKVYNLSSGADRDAFRTDMLNRDLWVEGAAKSGDVRDTLLTLRFADSSDADVCVDPIHYTIVKIDLDVNGDGDTDDSVDEMVGYIPGYEGATVKITFNGVVYASAQPMVLVAEPADCVFVTSVEYRITMCSDEPGFAMNSDGVPATDDNDYSFQAGAEDTEEIVVPNSGQAEAPFYCKDFGGLCEVEVRLMHGTDLLFQMTRRVPSDVNGNSVSDRWDTQRHPGTWHPATDDPDDSPPGDGTDGDHLSWYQEYRGFIVNGQHVRTDPLVKEIFICRDHNVPSAGVSGFLTMANLGAPVRAITTNEWAGVSRRINEQSETGALVPDLQTAIQVQDSRLGPGTWGITLCVAAPWVPNTLLYCRLDEQQILGPGTSLSSAINATQTTIPVVSTAGYRTQGGSIGIDGELIDYTGIAGNDFTGCTRGARGTVSAAHGNGAAVSNFVNGAEAVQRVFGHEAGHVMSLEDDYAPTAQHIMAEPCERGSLLNSGYWSTYAPALPGHFRVRP